jgi:hypothetical protein
MALLGATIPHTVWRWIGLASFGTTTRTRTRRGSPRNHTQMQVDFSASASWTPTTAYETIRDSLPFTLLGRWKSAADWNGVCGGTQC